MTGSSPPTSTIPTPADALTRDASKIEAARIEALARRASALDPDAPSRARLLHEVGEHVLGFLDQAAEEPAYQASTGPARALKDFPAEPRSLRDALDLLTAHVEHDGVALTSPRNLGYLPAGGLFHSALAALVSAAINRYPAMRSVSPGAVELESATVRWLADVVGYPPTARGSFTSGASLATVTAVVTAREHARLGDGDPATAVVYLTAQTHHCVPKALRLCGLGRVVQRRVAVDVQRRMSPEDLDRLIVEDRAAGRRPWLVVATAGTVNTGAVDPLDAVANVAQQHGLWLHVDGAYGGLYALCPEGLEVLSGLARANSVVVDPHKTLFLPYGTGVVLVRDGELLTRAFATDAAYLEREVDTEDGWPSPAEISPELTRPFRGLGLWLPLQLAGTDAFRAALSEKLHLARRLHRLLEEHDLFLTGPPPQLGVVAFQAVPPRRAGTSDRATASAATAELAARLRHDGQVFATTTMLDGQVHLRAAIGSFRTHLEDVDAAFAGLVDRARTLGSTVSTPSRGTAAHSPSPTRAGAPTQAPTLARSRPPEGEAVHQGWLEVVVDAGDEDLTETRRCELEVLARWYGDTDEDLEEAYGDYAQDTVFVAVRHSSHGVVGFTRLIAPGRLPQKTLADIGRPPWSVDGPGAARAAGLDLDRTWDVATVGARTDVPLPPGFVAGIVYSATLAVPLANGATSVVAIIDRRVRSLLNATGLILRDLPGTGPQPYMGSTGCTPVYAHIATMLDVQRARVPQAYRRFWLGQGLAAVRWRGGGAGTRLWSPSSRASEGSDRNPISAPSGYPLGELGGRHWAGEVISLQDVEAKVD